MSLVTIGGKIILPDKIGVPSKNRRLWLRKGMELVIEDVRFKLVYTKASRLVFDLLEPDVEIRELDGQFLTGVAPESGRNDRAAKRRAERKTGE